MTDRKYLEIVRHYESCLSEHGDTYRGVDWPNPEDARTRYEVMLEIIRSPSKGRPVTLLDFGCGASHLNEYISEKHFSGIIYSGLDISSAFINVSRSKFPSTRYYCCDILQEWALLPAFDYIIANGVFTEKQSLDYEEMLCYFERVLKVLFTKVETGLAFNVMSKHVDWERDDLFHLPMDTLGEFLTKELSRNFVIRNDYGLYEYTVYVYKK